MKFEFAEGLKSVEDWGGGGRALWYGFHSYRYHCCDAP